MPSSLLQAAVCVRVSKAGLELTAHEKLDRSILPACRDATIEHGRL